VAEKIKAVVLDLDGTIADTILDIAEALRKTLLKYNDYPFEEIERLSRKYIGKGGKRLLEDTYDALGIDKKELNADYEVYKAYYEEEPSALSNLYPNTKHLLSALKERKIPFALATHKPKKVTEAFLKSKDIASDFVYVFSYEDMAAPKPDPWCVEEVARRLSVKPREVLMAGDGMTDIGAGLSAGAYTVAVLGGYADQEVMQNCAAGYHVKDIGEILNIIDTVNGENAHES
jgi:phosphoglycolate phosphatase